MSTPTAHLDYAKAPSGHRRRIRRIGILLVIAALIISAVRWGRPAYYQVALLYWQHQCMDYQMPVNAVYYEPDPARASILARSNPTDYEAATRPFGAVFLRPRCWGEFDAAMQRLYPTTTRAFRQFRGAIYGPMTIFMHGMRTPSGARRLIVVEFDWVKPNGLAITSELHYRTYEPGRVFTRPRRLDRHAINYSGQYEPAEFGVGVTDGADPTHLTIPYSFKGQSGTIDGWLSDNDQVRFIVRDGPSKH